MGEPVFNSFEPVEIDYLKSILTWEECQPNKTDEKELPRVVRKVLSEKNGMTLSLIDKLKEYTADSFAEYICSFLSFSEKREINLDSDIFDHLKVPIFDLPDLTDEHIDDWVSKNIPDTFLV